MDINQLEVFVTVAREGSFSRAAQRLGRTQPAVSQAVRRLEDDIGEPLFDRSSREGLLTLAGDVLLEYATQMLSLRSGALSALDDLQKLYTGRLTITANEHTVFALLPLIAEFNRKNPRIKVEVQRGVASRIPKQITAREVELGAISFQPEDSSLMSVPIREDELLMIASPSHRLAGKKTVFIADLGRETFIAHNAPSPYRARVIEAFEAAGTELNIAVELPSLEAIKRLVAVGNGLAFVPRLAAESEVVDGRLKGLRVPELKLKRNINIVYRRNSVLSHAARAFIQLAGGHQG